MIFQNFNLEQLIKSNKCAKTQALNFFEGRGLFERSPVEHPIKMEV